MRGERLRILLAVDTLGIGGAERHVLDLARALCRRGHAVTVASSSGGPLTAELHHAGIEQVVAAPAPVKRAAGAAYAAGLRALIAARSFDVVHAHLYASAAAAVGALERLSLPLVVTEHGEGLWQGAAERAIARRYLRHASRAIAVSHPIGARVLHLGVEVWRVTVLPNAVPPAPDTPRRPDCAVPLVAAIARLCPEKGIDLFLEAIARCVPRHPVPCFAIVGDGPERMRLQRQAMRLGIVRQVRWLGEMPNARRLLGGVDVLCVPSRSEGTALVVEEAHAAGVPVVASAVGGLPTQIAHGRDGLVVPAGDVPALARALDALLDDAELRAAYGAAARARFDPQAHERTVDCIEGIYRAAVSETRLSISTAPPRCADSAMEHMTSRMW